MNVDLKYPILISPDGDICDGMHRMARLKLANERYMDVCYITPEQMDLAFVGPPAVRTNRPKASKEWWRK
eukprot:TRINITY_DN2948_c0_g1_i1.p1 TRINITY_DN2948_c0_g1~~TRINITY_DN2948_c0_g1_i1.p1  ORF type:complete len:70 (-),score=4.82 TRINITY_DN2948_c0_g1_i1:273-482(-)